MSNTQREKKIKRKTKEILIDEIEAKVHSSGNLLYHDWMARADKGRSVWKPLFDPLRKYTLAELQEIAGKVGVPNVEEEQSNSRDFSP